METRWSVGAHSPKTFEFPLHPIFLDIYKIFQHFGPSDTFNFTSLSKSIYDSCTFPCKFKGALLALFSHPSFLIYIFILFYFDIEKYMNLSGEQRGEGGILTPNVPSCNFVFYSHLSRHSITFLPNLNLPVVRGIT